MVKIKKALIPKILVFALILISAYGYAQNAQEGAFNYQAELNKLIQVPNSVEAQAFMNYGNVPVNLNVGAPEISIPIYTFKGLEFDLPISITYDINAHKVEDLSSSIGLGWNLNVGGRVSRVVSGKPDDFISIDQGSTYLTLNDVTVRNMINIYMDRINAGMQFNDVQEAIDYLEFLSEIRRGYYDTQMDFFSVNVGGINDYLVFDQDYLEVKPLKNPRLKVQFSRSGIIEGAIDTWTITDDIGNIYEFSLAETTKISYDDDSTVSPVALSSTYNSSWMLTKIISSNQKDVFEFDYIDFGPWLQENNFPTNKAIHYPSLSQSSVVTYNSSPQEVTPNTKYKIKQQYISEIRHNDKLVVKFNYKDRSDLSDEQDSALSFIEVLEPQSQSRIWYYKFFHSYFGLNSSEEIASKEDYELRLKLDSIGIGGADFDNTSNYSFKKNYKFNYDRAEQMPSRRAVGQDVLGFFNGNYGTGTLYPSYEYFGVNFLGNNRDFNHEKAKIGTLTELIYPTGGSSKFEYEAHQKSEYEVVENQQTLINISAVNDIGDANLCGVCCFDEFGNRPPNIVTNNFEVNQTESVIVKFNTTGSINGAEQAYLIGPLSNGISFTYDQIVCGASENVPYVLSFNQGYSSEELVILDAGEYQVFIVNPDIPQGELDNGVSEVSLNVSRTLISNNFKTTKYPGLRIKSITDYISPGIQATKKNYKYKSDINSEVTGRALRLNYLPTLVEEISTTLYSGAVGYVNALAIHRNSKPKIQNQPYLVYNTVYEVVESNDNLGTELSNGYTKYEFYNNINGVVNVDGVNNYYGLPNVGQVKELLEFNQIHDTLRVRKTKFRNDPSVAIRHFTSVEEPTRNLNYVRFYELPNQKVGISYPNGMFSTLNGGSTQGYPQDCLDGEAVCLPNSYATLKHQFSNAIGLVGNVTATIQTEYFPETNGKVITEVQKNYHDNSEEMLQFLLKSQITSINNNEIIKQNYYYPADFNTGYNVLLNENKLNIPVQMNTYSLIAGNEQPKLSIRKTIYNGSLPQRIQTSKQITSISNMNNDVPNLGTTNSPLEDRIYYEYYSNGNIKSSYQSVETDDLGNTNYSNLSTYIWGYNNSQLIAKVDNATYSQISSYVSNLQSLSNADNDNCREANCNEQQLRAALDALRTALPNAIVTTYTYDPLIGVTSITDPRGQTQYYEYDAFHRLKHVKDNEGNILSTNTYNYRTQN